MNESLNSPAQLDYFIINSLQTNKNATSDEKYVVKWNQYTDSKRNRFKSRREESSCALKILRIDDQGILSNLNYHRQRQCCKLLLELSTF